MNPDLDRFIVLGGHKCGTSSLSIYLAQHPEIIMPRIKGQDILNRPRLNIEDYYNSYDTIVNEKVFGEVSSTYLYSERAFQSIKKYFPHAKLLVILRNPVDRAFSHFNMLYGDQKLEIKFREFIQETQQYNLVYPILNCGWYYDNLKMYLDNFGRQQVCVLLFEDLIKNKEKFFGDFFEFIEVKQNFLPDTSIVLRKGGEIKWQKLHEIVFKDQSLRNLVKPIIKTFTTPQQRYVLTKRLNNFFITKTSLPNDLRCYLTNFYREDILRTQELIDIELSHWLKSV